ncbi:MAG: IPT/TIG domain-containing protein, partial [Planctomycetes bacterium]|nr:IPT/TIG domain-containing protein [Planctomycetota bacterium]
MRSRRQVQRTPSVLVFIASLGSAAVLLAAPPEFLVRPPGDEQAFTDSVYKAVFVATGCPEPQIVVDSPAGAIFAGDTLTYVPAGDMGDTFRVRVRAVNADGEAVADYQVTLVDELRLEFDGGQEFIDFFEPRLEDVPPSQLAGLHAEVRGGRLEIDVPETGEGETDNLDSWCGFDRTPRWWSKLRVFGAFEVETRLALKAADPGDPSTGYHVGLALDRAREDLLIQGVIRDRVEYERTCRWDGDFTLLNFFPGSWSQAVSLKIVVSGKIQRFFARRYDSDPWTEIGAIWDARPPMRGMGLSVKTWGDQTAFTASFAYFRYRGLTPQPPEIILPEGDHAFSGGEYCRRIEVISDLPASLDVLYPAGASIDPSGLFTYAVTESPGTSLEASVRATSSAGTDTRAWRIEVERPIRLEFDRDEDFTGEFFDPGTDQSTRRGEAITRVADGQLQIVLPEAGENDFDSWCGYDRSPRWLHRAQVTGSYAVEALVSFHTPPPLLPEGYHAGLAVDRGHQDLALLGAIREGVEYERTCSKGCENTDTFFPGQWSKADEKFYLRMEARCDEQVFLARPEGESDWTIIAGVAGRRPPAIGVGVGLKNWADEGLYAIAYDFFEYGPRGCGFIEVPEDGEVLAGSTYRARVTAQGVHPIYSLLSPAGATIDAETGEIEYHVPSGTPEGTEIEFSARVACGLNHETTSWILTVTASEPPVQITSVTPRVFSSLGKTPFVVRGANFTPQSEIFIQAAELATEFVDSSELRAVAPAHAPAQIVMGQVLDPVRGSAGFIVSYVGPLEINSISPDVVLAGREAWIQVAGRGFTPDTDVRVAQQTLPMEYIDVYTLRARVPSLDPGLYDVAIVAQSATGQWFTDSLSEGLTVAVALELTSVSPSEVSCLGHTPIEIEGVGFSEATTLSIEGVALPVEYVDSTTLRSEAPAHTAGAVTLMGNDPVTGQDDLPGVLTYVCGGAHGLLLESITPDRMTTGVPIDVEVLGLGFTPETGIRFGESSLTAKVFVDSRTIRGRTPPLAAGVYYPYAIDRDAAGQTITDILQEQ